MGGGVVGGGGWVGVGVLANFHCRDKDVFNISLRGLWTVTPRLCRVPLCTCACECEGWV